MLNLRKRTSSMVLVAGLAAAVAPTVALAQLGVTAGTINAVFADPSDFVVALDQTGPCGSGFFHIQRAAVNFDEMVAVVLTAFAANKTMTFFIASCGGDRNIVSHGYASR
jgi:hypothetical protein